MLSKLLAILMMLMSLSQDAIVGYEDQLSLGGNLFLINRDYRINADYVPDDLVMPNVRRKNNSVLMRAEAAHALEEMFAAAKREKGYTLLAVSGFRSYQTQRILHNRRVRAYGEKKANLTSAPPGASEHQLGLAMDIGRQKNSRLNESFGHSREGRWLAENCYRFGFILRYKAEWTETTGYGYESWHFRYVGVEHAMKIKELNIPLEDYVSLLREGLDIVKDEGKEDAA